MRWFGLRRIRSLFAREPQTANEPVSAGTAKLALGDAGEKAAADFLKGQGYTILQRNYTSPSGEIDIIASHKRAIVFVEVKTRSSDDFASPLANVTIEKQRRISRVAKHYCQRNRITNISCRFDVVSVLLRPPGKPNCELFSHAFPLRLSRRRR
jgi:putative endonuclease